MKIKGKWRGGEGRRGEGGRGGIGVCVYRCILIMIYTERKLSLRERKKKEKETSEK